jgi:pyrroloquinoline quinone biosynthesis protein B
MRLLLLGSAAGGGFPQWNCACRNCSRLRTGQVRSEPRSQAQAVVCPAAGPWFLINASPDLRSQMLSMPSLAPLSAPRSTPIAGVLLTSADVDCVGGLLHLREFQPLHMYATASVRRILLEENRIFGVLGRANPPAIWHDFPLNTWFSFGNSGSEGGQTAVRCRAVSLGGTYPDYVSESLRRSLPPDEAVIALVLTEAASQVFYAPSLPTDLDEWKTWAQTSDLCLLDGTFWDDRELISAGVGSKTAREMGHIPLSGQGGLLNEFKPAKKSRCVLIHINNTNPVLDEESPEHREVMRAGWEIGHDGMQFEL